jgi:hypothetical protein
VKKKFVFQKSPKFEKFQAILGAFYLATKIRILALKIRIFFLPQKKVQRVGSLNPNPWIRNNTSTACNDLHFRPLEFLLVELEELCRRAVVPLFAGLAGRVAPVVVVVVTVIPAGVKAVLA